MVSGGAATDMMMPIIGPDAIQARPSLFQASAESGGMSFILGINQDFALWKSGCHHASKLLGKGFVQGIAIRMRGIQTQAVKSILPQPVQRIGQKESPHA